MANAVTAIINPVHTEPAVPETLLFEIGAVNQLTVSYHPLDTARPAVPYTDNGTTAGNATKPNSLASAAVGGVINVFGLTDVAGQPADRPRKYNISRLSPIANPLRPNYGLTTIHPTISAVSDGATVWLYYLEQEVEGEDPVLYEVTLARGSKPNVNSRETPVSAGSKLAAFYDADKHRRVVFNQHIPKSGEATYLQMVTIEQNGSTSSTKISASGVAQAGSPLAVTTVAGKSGAARDIYLYMTNSNQQLYRIRQTGGDWQSPELIKTTENSIVLKGSQLVAVADAAHNHVFFIEKENQDNGYVNHRDPLVQ